MATLYRWTAAPIENPESFKSNIRIRGKTTVDSNIKKCWNSSALKIFTYFLENSWNAFN